MGLYLEAATSWLRSEFQIADLKFANLKFTICNSVGEVPSSFRAYPSVSVYRGFSRDHE